MNKKITAIAGSLASVGVISAASLGLASAAATSTSTSNVGSSNIPRSVFYEQRESAVAKVLNTTTDKVEAAHKDHKLKDLIKQAGLTDQTFHEKVKSQLTDDLKSKGYSQDEITIALQHRQIARMHHHDKEDQSKDQSQKSSN